MAYSTVTDGPAERRGLLVVEIYAGRSAEKAASTNAIPRSGFRAFG